MLRRIALALAWGLLLLIAIATLSPIGLRPHLGGVSVERFGAFAAFGLLLGMVYPRKFGLVMAVVVASAFLLEAAQFLTPDRHGRMIDAAVKAAGGVFGVILAFVLTRALVLIRPARSVSSVTSGDGS